MTLTPRMAHNLEIKVPYKIRINEYPAAYSECHSEAYVDTREEAIIYLWALAKQDIPQYGVVWLPMGVEPMTNLNMFQADPPESMREAIQAIVKTLNEPDIESLVVQGLNMVIEGLSRHGQNPEYVEKVVNAAKTWAEDCYQSGDTVPQKPRCTMKRPSLRYYDT